MSTLESKQSGILLVPCLRHLSELEDASWSPRISRPRTMLTLCHYRWKRRQRTRLTTNLNGTPCVRTSSLEKWKTPMTLSESSASASSRGISWMIIQDGCCDCKEIVYRTSAYSSTGSGILPIISDPVNSLCILPSFEISNMRIFPVPPGDRVTCLAR